MDKFTIMPNGISHNETPFFHARWTSGKSKEIPQNSQTSFYYEGSGEEDRILIDHIEWENVTLNQDQFNSLMNEAVTAIDNWICEQMI